MQEQMPMQDDMQEDISMQDSMKEEMPLQDGMKEEMPSAQDDIKEEVPSPLPLTNDENPIIMAEEIDIRMMAEAVAAKIEGVENIAMSELLHFVKKPRVTVKAEDTDFSHKPKA